MLNNRVWKSRNAALPKLATHERIDRYLIASAFDLEDLGSEVTELASSALPNYREKNQTTGRGRPVNQPVWRGSVVLYVSFRLAYCQTPELRHLQRSSWAC